MACENCKEKFENDELPKCEECGRLKTKINFSILSGKYICNCVRENESQEKELPLLPHQNGGMVLFYETQINKLREEKVAVEETIEVEREAHEDFMKVSEEWGKRQKQELLDEIKRLKEEVERLKEQNQKNVPEELVQEVESFKKQLEKANNQLAQIETPTKDKGIKNLFKFVGKK